VGATSCYSMVSSGKQGNDSLTKDRNSLRRPIQENKTLVSAGGWGCQLVKKGKKGSVVFTERVIAKQKNYKGRPSSRAAPAILTDSCKYGLSSPKGSRTDMACENRGYKSPKGWGTPV